MKYKEIVDYMKENSDPEKVRGMSRFGIDSSNVLGLSMPFLRKLAKNIGQNHEMAAKLWDSGLHEARILAGLVEETERITREQGEKWISEFDTWDLCDQVCNVFRMCEWATEKIFEWSLREEEFVKRAPFAMIAWMAVNNKKMSDGEFESFVPLLVKASADNRNYVKKAVSWALRQMGKRNLHLNGVAIAAAKEIEKGGSKPQRWISRDVLRELTSERIQERLKS